VHCSNVAEIIFTDKSRVACRSAPLPSHAPSSTGPWTFADGAPLSFVHDSAKEDDEFQVTDEVVMNYLASNFEQEDKLTGVDGTADKIIARRTSDA